VNIVSFGVKSLKREDFCPSTVHIRWSKLLDLRKRTQRVEALRLVMGLLKLLEESGAA